MAKRAERSEWAELINVFLIGMIIGALLVFAALFGAAAVILPRPG